MSTRQNKGEFLGAGFEGLERLKKQLKAEPATEVVPLQGGALVVQSSDSIPKAKEESAVEKEDEILAERIIFLLNENIRAKFVGDRRGIDRFLLTKKGRWSKKYRAIFRLVADSHTSDIDYELDRWLRHNAEEIPELGKIYEQLQIRGRKMSVVSWLRALEHQNDAYGVGRTVAERRQKKLEEARKAAKKANVSLEQVAKEYGLINVLNG